MGHFSRKHKTSTQKSVSADQTRRYPFITDTILRRQTPMQPQVYIRAVGRSNASQEDILLWGGYANMSDGPFVSYVQHATLKDYMNGNMSAKEYVWTDKSGNSDSISIVPDPSRVLSTSVSSTGNDVTQTVTTASKPTFSSSSSGGAPMGAIAGGVVGGVAFLVLLGLGLFLCFGMKRRSRQA